MDNNDNVEKINEYYKKIRNVNKEINRLIDKRNYYLSELRDLLHR